MKIIYFCQETDVDAYDHTLVLIDGEIEFCGAPEECETFARLAAEWIF